jgi:hypothetical protein
MNSAFISRSKKKNKIIESKERRRKETIMIRDERNKIYI